MDHWVTFLSKTIKARPHFLFNFKSSSNLAPFLKTPKLNSNDCLKAVLITAKISSVLFLLGGFANAHLVEVESN